MDLKLNASYFDREAYNVSSGTGAAFERGPGKMTSTPNTTFDGSVQLGSAIGNSHYLLAGLTTHRSTLDRKVYQSQGMASSGRFTALARWTKNRRASRTSAFFLQDQYFTDALTLYVGGSYNHWTTSGVAKNMSAHRLVRSTRLSGPIRFHAKSGCGLPLKRYLSLRTSWGKAFRAHQLRRMYATPSKSTDRLVIADLTSSRKSHVLGYRRGSCALHGKVTSRRLITIPSSRT